MKSYLDSRTLITKEYETLRMPETLTAVTVFCLPAQKKVELDEVGKAINNIVSKQVFDGYEVEDKRVKVECGASGASQEFILGIMVGVSANISYDMLKAIFIWAKSKINLKQKKELTNIEDYIDTVKDIITKHFLPIKKLSVLEIQKTVTVVKAKLEDERGNKYEVELFPDGKIIKIKKITIA